MTLVSSDLSFAPPTTLARLLVLNGQLHVESAGPAHPAALRTPLTPLLRSTVLRLQTASDLFYLRHQRCLAALLLLNLTNGLWAVRLPRQTCGVAGATWTHDMPGSPSSPGSPGAGGTANTPILYVIAGSFQTVRQPDWQELVPACDGLHLVRHQADTEDALYATLVAGGLRRPVPIPEAVVDDYQQMLADAAGRMTLEAP